MSIFFLNIVFTNLFYLVLGKFLITKFFNFDLKTPVDCVIMGIIGSSFAALLINFFLPFNIWVNSSFFILLIIIFFIFKLYLKKNELFFLLISSFLVFLLIIFDNEYRPDAGLYHIPYIQILNENKIIIGLSNLHSRFGHISILQYLSAFNFDFLRSKNGILIPSASLVIFLYIYFFYDILKLIKKKELFSLGKLFSILIIIYISYKINRYGEFGNDAPAHIFLFYVISKFLYLENYSTKQIWKFYIYSVFCFLNKIFFILIFIIPIFMLFKNSNSIKKLILSIPSFLIFLWLVKNILISGCMIYPMKITCFESLPWVNINTVEKVQIEGEAWAKAWPQNQDTNLNMEDFSKNFNWIEAWSSNHLLFILNIIIPYLIFVLIFMTLSIQKISFRKFFDYFKNEKIQILTFISILGVLSFFMKFPIYRYGYSYLILLFFILFSVIFNNFNLKKLIKYSKVIFVLCIVIFSSKQILRIYNYNEIRNYIPNHIFIKKEKYENKYKKINLNNNFKYYLSKDEYFYGLAPCTNSIYWQKNLSSKNKWGYNILFTN